MAGNIVITPNRASGTQEILITPDVTTPNAQIITSPFAGGFGQFGGWKLDNNLTTTGRSTFQIDDIWVRGRMSVYELMIQQIRATNGSIWASATSKVDSVSGGSIYQDPDLYISVYTNDILYAKRTEFNGLLETETTTFESVISVGTITNTKGTECSYTYTLLSGDAPVAGADYVRIGNSTDLNRQGSIYLTADDVGAPFIRVYDEVSSWADFGTFNTLKLQAGKLTNVTDPTFGTLKGHGIYTRNAYLSGNAQIAGTLTAGDENGVGNTFYAGLINRNLIRQSEDLSSNTYWLENGVMTRVYPSTSNGYEATKVTFPNHADPYLAAYTDTGKPTGEYTFSVWLWTDAGQPTDYQIFLISNSGNNSETITLTETPVRYSVTYNSTDTTNLRGRIDAPANTSPGHFYVWGAQLEYGSTATNYQLTGIAYGADNGYGVWMNRGGVGATIQAPIISFNEQGMTIINNGITADMSNNSIHIGNFASGSTHNGAIRLSNTGTNSDSGLFGYTSAGDESFALRLDGTAQIAGWAVTEAEFTGTNARLRSSGVLSLGSGDGYDTANCIYIDGANSKMSIGTGFTYTGGSLDINGSATIGGWAIGGDKIEYSVGAVEIGMYSTTVTPGFRAHDYTNPTGFRPYVSMGKTYYKGAFQGIGFAYTEGGSDTGLEPIFVMDSVSGNKIAGWTFDDQQLTSVSSDQGIEIDSSDNQIRLGNLGSGDQAKMILNAPDGSSIKNGLELYTSYQSEPVVAISTSVLTNQAGISIMGGGSAGPILYLKNTVAGTYPQATFSTSLINLLTGVSTSVIISNGDVTATGTITASNASAGVKNFVIPHPTKKGHELLHSAVESPTSGDNLYRYIVEVVNGKATIPLEDWWTALNENLQVWVTPKGFFANGYGDVDLEKSQASVYGEKDGLYNILIVGTRKDPLAKKYWKGVERKSKGLL